MCALQSSAGYKLWNEWLTRLKLAQQAAAALDFMHAHSVLHLDITSHNLLVTETWQAKVADFNLSRAVQRDSVPHSGSLNSPQWSSPERLRGEVRTPHVSTAHCDCLAEDHGRRPPGHSSCQHNPSHTACACALDLLRSDAVACVCLCLCMWVVDVLHPPAWKCPEVHNL